MYFAGHMLKVVKECPLLNVGDVVYCIEDCSSKKIFRIWSRKPIYGVNEVIFPYAKRSCFKII